MVCFIFFKTVEAVHELGHNVFRTAFRQIWVTSAQALAMFRMAW
jgi:hypothetical protein